MEQIADDYKDKLATPIYIGIRAGYLQNEEAVKSLGAGFIIGSPISIVNEFNITYLNNE